MNPAHRRHHTTILLNSRKRKNYRDIPGNQRPLGIVRGQALQATIIVAGVPGVGKTTILQELEAVATERKVPLKIINFGNVMNELFKNRGVEIHRDHMRKEDISLQAKIQEEAARMISKTPGNSTLVVDTHMFVRTNDGIWPGTPRKVLEALGSIVLSAALVLSLIAMLANRFLVNYKMVASYRREYMNWMNAVRKARKDGDEKQLDKLMKRQSAVM